MSIIIVNALIFFWEKYPIFEQLVWGLGAIYNSFSLVTYCRIVLWFLPSFLLSFFKILWFMGLALLSTIPVKKAHSCNYNLLSIFMESSVLYTPCLFLIYGITENCGQLFYLLHDYYRFFFAWMTLLYLVLLHFVVSDNCSTHLMELFIWF